jgi:ABC-type sugar transport system permease subunit
MGSLLALLYENPWIEAMYEFLKRVRKRAWAYAFVLPMFVLFLGFTLYPVLDSVRYTFYNWNGIGDPKNFVGLQHYIHIAHDPFFWNAFKHTALYTLVLVPVQLTLALGLAVVLNSRRVRGRYALRAVFFSPIVTSSAIVGIVITILSTTAGDTVNRALVRSGLLERSIDWLGDPRTALWLIIAVGIWIGLGYPLIYFLAALQSIEPDLYDAARVDGAGAWALFRHITIPMIRPVGLVILLITSLHSLRVFDVVQVMTQGGPYFATDVVSTYIYRQAFFVNAVGDSDSRLGYASAAAFFMGLLIMGISVLQYLAVRSAARQRPGKQTG